MKIIRAMILLTLLTGITHIIHAADLHDLDKMVAIKEIRLTTNEGKSRIIVTFDESSTGADIKRQIRQETGLNEANQTIVAQGLGMVAVLGDSTRCHSHLINHPKATVFCYKKSS